MPDTYTREEAMLLLAHWNKYRYASPLDGQTEPVVLEAMRNFAKQEAILFSLWVNAESNGWFIVNPDEDIWGSLLNHETKTTDQLYTLFTESKQTSK